MALQTGGVGFAVSQSGENISGLKNLLNGESLPEMLDFLERIDQHKGVLLDLDKKAENQELMTIFGSENAVLPLGKGYALVASKAIINNEKTVFGILAQPQILGRKKTLQILNSISQILNEKDEE